MTPSLDGWKLVGGIVGSLVAVILLITIPGLVCIGQYCVH